MLLKELKKQVQNLTINEDIKLKDIIKSLQINSQELTEQMTIIKEIKGLLKTEQLASNAQKVAHILVEYKINKYY